MKTEALDQINTKGLRVLADKESIKDFIGAGAVRVEPVLITPNGARELLELNSNNRKLKNRKVDRLAQSLREGRWFLTNDAITLDRNGVFVNGQHRLSACIDAEAIIEVLFLVGVEPESRQIVDTGTKRTLSDALVMSGQHAYASTIASSAVMHYRYTHRALALTSTGGIGFFDRPNHDVMMNYIAEHPEIAEAAPEGMGTYLIVRAFKSTAATTFIAITRQIDADLSEEFIAKLKSGSGLKPKEPVLLLSNLYRNVQNRASWAGKRPSEWALAAALKAWNYTRQGREIESISVRSTETYPEAI